MSETYNIYIDESCHLERDKSEVMCIGYTKINKKNRDNLKGVLKAIKYKYKSPTEVKWNQLSMSRWDMYKELIDFFFRSDIEFRSVLIKNKQNLGHERYNRENQNSYYYKTLKTLLTDKILRNNDEYRVYLDVKDTRGKTRLLLLEKELEKELNPNGEQNFPFTHFQHIHSDENEFLQLTDLFIGAICYKTRKEHLKKDASLIKIKIVEYLENLSKYSLDEGTEPWETKFFIHDFQIKPISND